MNNVVSYLAILGQNVSYVRYKYDVNFNDRLYDNITRLINASVGVFCAWNCSDVLHGFTGEMIEIAHGSEGHPELQEAVYGGLVGSLFRRDEGNKPDLVLR